MAETAHGMRGILFDWHGTLMNLGELIEQDLHAAKTDFGRNLTEADVRALFGRAPEAFYSGLFGVDVPTDLSLAKARATLRKYDGLHPKRLVPGAAETIRTLRSAGLVVGLVTGDVRRYALREMSQSGLPRPDFILTGSETTEDVREGNSAYTAPREFFDVLYGILPEQVLVVGDEYADVHQANHAGLNNYVAVSSGVMSEEQLLAEGVPRQRIIESIAALPEWLGIQSPQA